MMVFTALSIAYMLLLKSCLSWALVHHVTSVYFKGPKQISVLQYVGILTLYQLMKLQYLTVNLS